MKVLPLIWLSLFLEAIAYTYTDKRGIVFWQLDIASNVVSSNPQFGLALPPASQTALASEYIAHIVVPRTSTGEWMGFTHGPGMTNSLLLLAWVDGSGIRTDFRYAPSYTAPDEYTGNATLSVIDSKVNSTHFELFYRCQNCWQWDQNGATASQLPRAGGNMVIGWAQATEAPSPTSQHNAVISQHAGADVMVWPVDSAQNSAYTSWTSYAKPATTTTFESTTSSTSPTPSCISKTALPPYDYIVVGAGAAGIPLAAKLAAKGKQTLLIERGTPSSGRWGGTMKAPWLIGTNLTRFDVPGLDNEIYVNSTGIFCPDYTVRSGCVLGGGTAVNAGLWWRPPSKDFDLFPAGWRAPDMQPAIERLFKKLPFNDKPSDDGIIYLPQGYDVLSGILMDHGWKSAAADSVPDSKDKVFSRPEYFYIHGERGGPMATYLVDASKLSTFTLIMNTAVDRLVREGGKVTGVQVSGSQCGVISLKPGGKVILSAGAFGTPKILFRSGIGPIDQLNIVKNAEGSAMPTSDQWINLPVGYNLHDNPATDIVIKSPTVQFYDFYKAFNNPIPQDKDKYLVNRTGILAQSAPNLSLVGWQEHTGSDGVTRQIQYSARTEGSQGVSDSNSIAITHYLGRGAQSSGRLVITSSLTVDVRVVPFFNNSVDLEVAVASMQSMLDMLRNSVDITVAFPPKGMSAAQMFAALPVTSSARSSNHWMGTCKMGLDSGLTGGTSVVDQTAKVYSTDNLYIVDASIIPGYTTSNPSALIASLAERASEIL